MTKAQPSLHETATLPASRLVPSMQNPWQRLGPGEAEDYAVQRLMAIAEAKNPMVQALGGYIRRESSSMRSKYTSGCPDMCVMSPCVRGE